MPHDISGRRELTRSEKDRAADRVKIPAPLPSDSSLGHPGNPGAGVEVGTVGGSISRAGTPSKSLERQSIAHGGAYAKDAKH